jgi:hypothetical protein
MGKETKQRAASFYRMHSSLLASAAVTEFQPTEPHSSFDLTKVKYTMYR